MKGYLFLGFVLCQFVGVAAFAQEADVNSKQKHELSWLKIWSAVDTPPFHRTVLRRIQGERFLR